MISMVYIFTIIFVFVFFVFVYCLAPETHSEGREFAKFLIEILVKKVWQKRAVIFLVYRMETSILAQNPKI